MIYLFLADGFEESEAIVPADLMRRAGIELYTVGVGGRVITGSHGIAVKTDLELNEIELGERLEGVVLPGGKPGTANLKASGGVRGACEWCARKGRLVAAICAAPTALDEWGLLEGRTATAFPGSGREGRFTDSPIEVDGNYITGRAAGAAFDFGLALVRFLRGAGAARELRTKLYY